MLQARNREINIFNLSMMDVISGAMGAFLIIVILLSRYYDSDPANKETVVKIEEELKQALARAGYAQNMLELKQGDVASVIEQIRAAKYNIDNAQQQLEDVREQLDQAQSNLDRLEEEKEELQTVNRGLDARRPFILQSWANCEDGNPDMYLEDSAAGSDGHTMPPFDPVNQQWTYWTGDQYIDGGGVGRVTETWMTLAVYPDVKYKLYYKLDQGRDTVTNCSIQGRIFSNYFETVEIPEVRLSKDDPWTLVGSFQVNEDRKIGDFKAATDEEKAAEKVSVPKRLEEYAPVKEAREQSRKEKGLEDPDAHKKEETQLPQDGSEKRKKPFWAWWQQ